MISPTGATNNKLRKILFSGSNIFKGFTLIELLLVVVLLGVVAGITIPNFAPAYAGFQLKETAQNITYLMRYAQSRAVIKDKEHVIAFDEGDKHYQLFQVNEGPDAEETLRRVSSRLGRSFKIPNEITVEPSSKMIRFYPDGTIDKVRVSLSSKKGNRYTISSEYQRGQIFLFDYALP